MREALVGIDSETTLGAVLDVLNAIPDALIVTDEAGRISNWNRGAEALYGWPASEVVGRSIFEVTVPDIGQDEAQSIMSALSNGGSWSGHFRVRRRDGSQFRAYVRNLPVFGDDGRVQSIVGLSEEATDEVLFQETFDLAMRAGGLGVWEWDASTDRVSWSTSLEVVYGLSPGSFSGRFDEVQQRLHPDDREYAVSELRGALERGRELRFEHRIQRADGAVRWLETRGEPIVAPTSAIHGVRGVSIDVTERKEAEARAARRERQEAAVADLGREALIGGDAHKLTERAVAVVAETLGLEFARVLQSDEDQVAFTVLAAVGWGPELAGKPLAEDGLEHARYTVRAGQPVVIGDLATEKRFRPPRLLLDQGVVSGISMVIRGRRRPWGLLGAFTAKRRTFGPDDVYFVRSMANVLGLAMDARAAAENRDSFISLVSHELRNPLTTIQGFASLLQRRAREDATPDETASLDFIVRESRRMETTLQLLLDVARLDAEGLTLTETDIDLKELVAAEVEALRLRHPEVEVDEQYPDGPVILRSDHDRIAQVLTNLLDNAVKYGGGRVEVSVARQSEGVAVRVRDNGMGIAADDLPHIFKRFYRGSAPAGEARAEGSGLGLYISQRVAQRLGARIVGESELGRGSVFTLTFAA